MRLGVQGLVAIPMNEVIHKKTVIDTFQMDATKHGQLDEYPARCLGSNMRYTECCWP